MTSVSRLQGCGFDSSFFAQRKLVWVELLPLLMHDASATSTHTYTHTHTPWAEGPLAIYIFFPVHLRSPQDRSAVMHKCHTHTHKHTHIQRPKHAHRCTQVHTQTQSSLYAAENASPCLRVYDVTCRDGRTLHFDLLLERSHRDQTVFI